MKVDAFVNSRYLAATLTDLLVTKCFAVAIVHGTAEKTRSPGNNSVSPTSNRKNWLRFSFRVVRAPGSFEERSFKTFPPGRFSVSFVVKFRGTEATFMGRTLCAATRKDDPNSRFAASVFGFIFSSPAPHCTEETSRCSKCALSGISAESTSVCSPIRGLLEPQKLFFLNIEADFYSCSWSYKSSEMETRRSWLSGTTKASKETFPAARQLATSFVNKLLFAEERPKRKRKNSVRSFGSIIIIVICLLKHSTEYIVITFNYTTADKLSQSYIFT